MKKILLLAVFILATLSCSEEDDSSLVSDVNYFPLEIENSWTYSNQSYSNTENSQGTETLTINNQDGNRFSFTQIVNSQPGLFTSVLASGEVYKQNGNQKIIYDGNLSLALDNNLQNFEFPLDDIILYDANLSQGDVMFSNAGELQQNINGFPVDFEYEINSTHKGFLISEVINDVTYEDIFVSEINISLSASVFLVISNFSILQKQDIIKITNYYAKDIGLIYSKADTEIIFEDIPEQLNTEISDVNTTSTQNLMSYSLSTNL
ncbi:hypothetical protein ACFQ0R_06700 [Psychroflexus salinarum]|uniref:Uncharacterized protein n=1 Tax=Psychroflexus salinarum TaxID=546024 RepID=A0ABW3GV54_9FLAO